ncbi:MAG: hypothetical protein ACLQPN_17180 [Bryobacteraceae bacterium]
MDEPHIGLAEAIQRNGNEVIHSKLKPQSLEAMSFDTLAALRGVLSCLYEIAGE